MNKGLLSLILVCILSSAQAQQKIIWKLKPVKYDIDRIFIASHEENKLFIVSKNKKSGVVNSKGKLIMPIKYTHPDIWPGSGFVSGMIDKKQYYFTHKGKVTNWEYVKAHLPPQKSETWISKTVKSLNRPENFSLYKKGHAIIIKGDNGLVIDTIKVDRRCSFKNDNIYVGKESFFVLTKNKQYSFKDVGRFVEAVDNFIVLSNDKKLRGLYDYDMNELLPMEFKGIDFSENSNSFNVRYPDKKGGKIMDYNLKVLREGAIGYVYYLNDNKAFFKKGDKHELLDLESGSVTTIPFPKIRHIRHTDLIITRGDSLSGVFDLSSGKEVLPPSHKYLIAQGRYLIGYDKKKGVRPISIYDKQGKKLVVLDGVKTESSLEYLLVTNKTSAIINEEGETIQDDVTASVASNGFLKITGEGFKPYYTPATNFYAGNTPKLHYDAVFKSVKSLNPDAAVLVVAQKGKYKGLVKKNGQVVYPFVFDDIYPEIASSGLVSVKYKGRLGVVVVPNVIIEK